MRVAFLVYGVLYVGIEIVGCQLERVSWPEITALDVATAVTNALLTIAVLVAALVAVDVLGHRWRRHLRAVRLERARLAATGWIDGEWIDGNWIDAELLSVHAWRPEPLALPAAPAPAKRGGAPNAYARQAWPEDAADSGSAARLL
jgi:hypothetical protein